MMVVSLLFTFLEHFKVVYPNMCWCAFMTSLAVVNSFRQTDWLYGICDMYIFMQLCHKMVFAKLIPLIPKPHFWICIYLFQTDLFDLKFMISAMTFI